MRTIPLLAGLILPGVAAAKKKKDEPAPPPVGWHVEEGWAHSCFHPPDWAQLNTIDRKMKRAEALDEMIAQWRGGRDDGITFPEQRIDDLETTLLGRPEDIESTSAANLGHCKASATGSGSDAWGAWLRDLPGKLTEGECHTPFDYTMFDYLDIGNGWQRPMPICQGDRVQISGTSKDRFRVSDDGPWITVAGDPDRSTSGMGDYPCNLEGCLEGMLLLKFTTEAGIETILPVGSGIVFEAPEHGEIAYRINDVSLFDNKWYTSGGIEDHTAIEISPAP